MVSEIRLAETWRIVHAAQRLAETTRDEQVKACWTYFLRHAVFAEPTGVNESGAILIDAFRPEVFGEFPRSGPFLNVVCTQPKDALIEPRFSLQPSRGASYVTGHWILLYPGDTETEFFLGAKFLHEIYHAFSAARDNRIDITRKATVDEKLLEEGDARFFEARLWKEFGGEPYRRALDEAVAQVRRTTRRTPDRIELFRREEWLDAIDTAFGPASLRFQRNVRAGSFVMNAHFEFSARHPTPSMDPRGYRANVVRAVYAHAGIEP